MPSLNECHETESLWNHTTAAHKVGEQSEDRRNVGESSCNFGDGTDQRVQSLMFMMMMIFERNYYRSPVLRSVCLMQRWQLCKANCSINLYPYSTSFSLQAEESTCIINVIFITLYYGSQELLPEHVCPTKHTQPLLFLWGWFVECNDLSSFQFCPVSPKLASYLPEFKAFVWQNILSTNVKTSIHKTF